MPTTVELPQVLARLGFRSNDQLGQHFLTDLSVLDRMLDAAGPLQGVKVVEIGPGFGVLSERLLEAGARVTALEQDPRFVGYLREQYPSLEVREGDALELLPHIWEEWGEGVRQAKVVANIPYGITSPLIRFFLEKAPAFAQSYTLLVQKEVAERLTAQAGERERSYLSLLVEYLAPGVIVGPTVKPDAFWPRPKVDSAVIHLVPTGTARDPEFLKFLRHATLQPRKQLQNVLAGTRGDGTSIVTWLEQLHLPAHIRGHQLTLAQWQDLYTLWKK